MRFRVRSPDDIKVVDGDVRAAAHGVFGKGGKVNLTLRERDLRASAPHSAGNPHAAAAKIRAQRAFEYGGIRGGPSRADELGRRARRRAGMAKLTVQVEWGSDGDPRAALEHLFRVKLTKTVEVRDRKTKDLISSKDEEVSLVESVADVSESQIELTVKDVIAQWKSYGFGTDGEAYLFIWDTFRDMPGKKRVKGVKFRESSGG